jgi:hypothetical protein
MTLIAYKAGVLAADSAVWQGDIFVGLRTKILRLEDGGLYAAAGLVPNIHSSYEWIKWGAPLDRKPEKLDQDSFGAVWIKPDGALWRINYRFELYEDAGDVAAEGCMTEFMLGAMRAGASSERAVCLAIEYSNIGRPPVCCEAL